MGESKKKQVYEVTISEAGGPAKNETILAVKNNLLYDLALAPNIEVEIPMGRRWSLNTEYKCPWWLNSKHNFCYQLLSGGVEVTYGYARQLARHFSIEFSLGIGYLTTEYKKYTPYEGDIIWANSGRYNFIGPTKAKVSLVWLITKRRR